MALITDAEGTARSARNVQTRTRPSPSCARTANVTRPWRRSAYRRAAATPGRQGARAAACVAGRAGVEPRASTAAITASISSRDGVRRAGRVRYHVHLSVMSNDVTRAFDAHADEYEAQRRRLVPCFDAFYGAAVEALAPVPVKRVLDLGAGTGTLSVRIAEAHPEARFVLVDGAPAMLERAAAAPAPRVSPRPPPPRWATVPSRSSPTCATRSPRGRSAPWSARWRSTTST